MTLREDSISINHVEQVTWQGVDMEVGMEMGILFGRHQFVMAVKHPSGHPERHLDI